MKYLILIISLCSFTAKSQQNGTNLFDDSYVHEIRINFYEANFWDTLVHYNLQSVGLMPNKYLMADVEIDGNQVDSIGVRFKGESSNFNSPTKKRPFKLDFPEFVSGKRYDGLKKINLNNAWTDPSMLRDALGYKVLRDFGLTASRTAFANVYLNDTLWGVYTMVEQVDNKFLNNWFNDNDGDLFKCNINTNLEYFNMDTILYAQEMDPKNNDKATDWENYDNFLYHFNFPSANFEDSLRKYMNVESFLRAMAADYVMDNPDNYIGSGNNFYMYLNPDDYRYYWIPWDYNLIMNSFSHQLIPNFPCLGGGLYDCQYLMKAVLTDPDLTEEYVQYACELLTEHFDTTVLYQYLDDASSLIAPHVANDSLKHFPAIADFYDGLSIHRTYTDAVGNTYQINGLKPRIKELGQLKMTEIQSEFNMCYLSYDEIDELDLLLYPNPTNSQLWVQGLDDIENFVVRIYSLEGKLLIESRTNELILDGLTSGMYVIKVSSDKGLFKSVFIKH